MVTAYSACHAGRDTYDAYGVSDGEYLQCYGDKYAEGTPAGTRSEAEEAADKEYYGRQEGLEALEVARDRVATYAPVRDAAEAALRSWETQQRLLA